MALSKELQDIYEKAISTRDGILKTLEPLRTKEADLRNQIKPIQGELDAVLNQIAEAEKTGGLADASRTISALSPKAIKLKADGGGVGVKM